jgi:hypothetical protein
MHGVLMAQDDLLNVYQTWYLQYVAFFLNSYPHLMLEQHLDDMGVFLSRIVWLQIAARGDYRSDIMFTTRWI